MYKLLVGFWAWIIDQAIGSAVWAFLISTGITLVGYFKEIPIYYLLVGFVFVFSQAAIFIFRFQEWRTKTSPEHKLAFVSPRAQRTVFTDDKRMVVVIGVLFRNFADFPMYTELLAFRTSFDGLYSPDKGIDKRRNSVTLAVNGVGWYDNHSIEVSDASPYKNRIISGTLECLLKYGKKSKWSTRLRYPSRFLSPLIRKAK